MRLLFLILTMTGCCNLVASADEIKPQGIFSSEVSASVGYEGEELSHTDDRSGVRVSVTMNLLETREKRGFNFRFFPLSIELSPNSHFNSTFGRVTGLNLHDHVTTDIRRLAGVLIQSSYNEHSGRLRFRAKLAGVEFDRDRGFTNWKILGASVVLVLKKRISDTETKLVFEISAGSDLDILELNNYGVLKESLHLTTTRDHFTVLVPNAGAKVGINAPWGGVFVSRKYSYRIGGASTAEAESKETATRVVADFKFRKNSSFYISGEHLDDTLTLDRALFGGDDTFQSTSFFVGIRVKN